MLWASTIWGWTRWRISTISWDLFKLIFSSKYHYVQGEINLWIDARLFHNKYFPKGHMGEHEANFTYLIEHGDFGNWLGDIKEKLEVCKNASDATHIKVCCFLA